MYVVMLLTCADNVLYKLNYNLIVFVLYSDNSISSLTVSRYRDFVHLFLATSANSQTTSRTDVAGRKSNSSAILVASSTAQVSNLLMSSSEGPSNHISTLRPRL